MSACVTEPKQRLVNAPQCTGPVLEGVDSTAKELKIPLSHVSQQKHPKYYVLIAVYYVYSSDKFKQNSTFFSALFYRHVASDIGVSEDAKLSSRLGAITL
jgi:hypothetical protein